jgi:hypothetical protein
MAHSAYLRARVPPLPPSLLPQEFDEFVSGLAWRKRTWLRLLFRIRLYVHATWFSNVMLLAIIANTAVLAMEYDGMSTSLEHALVGGGRGGRGQRMGGPATPFSSGHVLLHRAGRWVRGAAAPPRLCVPLCPSPAAVAAAAPAPPPLQVNANYVFVALFTLEMGLKLLGLGFWDYIQVGGMRTPPYLGTACIYT